MGVWIRETRGTSWRDPKVPGTRHWRSRSVGMSLPFYLLSLAVWWFAIFPVVAMVWLALEVGFLFASAILAVVVMAMYRRGPANLRLVRWGWFLVIDVDLG